MNPWPSVCIFTSGVRPIVSPKSYTYLPLVRLGQALGSTATPRSFFFLPASLSATKGEGAARGGFFCGGGGGGGGGGEGAARGAPPPADAADEHVGLVVGLLELL